MKKKLFYHCGLRRHCQTAWSQPATSLTTLSKSTANYIALMMRQEKFSAAAAAMKLQDSVTKVVTQ